MQTLQFRGPARVLRLRGGRLRRGRERATTRTARSSSSATRARKGGPGMREMLSTTAALYGQGMGDKVALITDGRFSGAHARLLHRPCRAGGGGRRADRAARGRRHHRDRRRRAARSTSSCRTSELAERRDALEAARDRDSARASCGNMPRPSGRRVRRGDPSRRRGGDAELCGYLAPSSSDGCRSARC